jgi:hypothetical protein
MENKKIICNKLANRLSIASAEKINLATEKRKIEKMM